MYGNVTRLSPPGVSPHGLPVNRPAGHYNRTADRDGAPHINLPPGTALCGGYSLGLSPFGPSFDGGCGGRIAPNDAASLLEKTLLTALYRDKS